MEHFSGKKITLVSILLLVLVIVTAYLQITIHFSTYIALVIMIIGTILATRYLTGPQG